MERIDESPFFVGRQVILRAMEPEDLDFLYQIENDTTLWPHGISNVPYSRDALRQFIQKSQNDIYADRQLRLMVVLKESREVIGCIDLFDYNVRHSRAEIGLVIAGPFQHRGLGHEALALLLRYAFSFLRLHQVYAYVVSKNTPAIHLFEHIGFERVAVLKDWTQENGVYRNVDLYTLCQD